MCSYLGFGKQCVAGCKGQSIGQIKRASASSCLLEVVQWQVAVTCGKMTFTGALTSSLTPGPNLAKGQYFLSLVQICQVSKVVLQIMSFHESRGIK